MIEQLYPIFSIMENAAYAEYLVADKIGKEKITRGLAKVEARMIMDLIEKTAKNRLDETSKTC